MHYIIRALSPRFCPLHAKIPLIRFPLKQNVLYLVYSSIYPDNLIRPTLLTGAAFKGNPEMVGLLLRQPGVDVDLANSMGKSPLAEAAESPNATKEVFDMIWERSSECTRRTVQRPARFM